MKAWSIIWRILVSLTVLAGVIFVIAAFGDKIVAWSKKLTRKVINTFRKAPLTIYDQEEDFDDSEVAAQDFETE